MIHHDIENNGKIASSISLTYGLFSSILLGDWDKLLSQLPKQMIVDDDRFNQFLRKLKDTDVMELKIQYDNLFVAPGYYFVSPYLTSYSPNYERIRSELSAITERFRLSICDERQELPDHLGCILACMQVLVHHEWRAWEEGKVAESSSIHLLEKQFIEKYLYFIPELEGKVKAKLEYGLILDAITHLKEFISWHYDLIKEDLKL